MRQLVHGDGGPRRTVVIKIFSVHFVVAGEIIHVHEISGDLDDIAQVRARTRQNVANILDARREFAHECRDRVAPRASASAPAMVLSGAARAGAGDKQVIAGALDVRKLPARLCFPFDDFAFRLLIVIPAFTQRPAALQANTDIVQFRIKIQRVHSAFAADSRKPHAAKRRAQIAQEPAVHPSDARRSSSGPRGGRGLRFVVQTEAASPYCVSFAMAIGLFLGVERRDVANGTEDFFLHAASRFRQAQYKSSAERKSPCRGYRRIQERRRR